MKHTERDALRAALQAQDNLVKHMAQLHERNMALRADSKRLVAALRKCLDQEAAQIKWIEARALLRSLGEEV